MTNRFFRGTTWNHCIFTEILLNNPNIQFMYTIKCRMTSTYRIFSIALVVYAASDIGGMKPTLWLSSLTSIPGFDSQPGSGIVLLCFIFAAATMSTAFPVSMFRSLWFAKTTWLTIFGEG